MSPLKEARCFVLLTFDFDAESAQVRKTPDLPVSLSKGQFGPRVGVQRILEFLEEHDIKATFFTPAWTAENYSDQVLEIARRGHEIAAHGYMHENFSELDAEREWEVHQKSVDILRKLLGSKPIGFRAPYWEWSTRTLRYIRDCGFKYDSSLMNDDKPYLIHDNEAASRLHELPVEWFLDDWDQFEIQRQSPSNVLDAWRSEFDAVYEMKVGYFLLTMHPECIGRASRMKLLEELVKHMLEKTGVAFARCDELVSHLDSSDSR
jgi:peptidoglycan/xylan/chitin deacetylase (PgdA/CDA1 family)